MAREDAAYTLWQPSSFAASAASLSAMLFRSGSAGRWPWRVCTSRPDGICRKGATATGCNIILTSTPFGGAAATRALRAPTQAAMKTQLPFWSCLGGSKKWGEDNFEPFFLRRRQIFFSPSRLTLAAASPHAALGSAALTGDHLWAVRGCASAEACGPGSTKLCDT